jgi:hypothetical protein
MDGARLARARRRRDGTEPHAWLVRLRWRRRGAWLWPAFAIFTVSDAIVGHALPPQGETQSLVAALLLACVLNLIGVVLLTRPLGALLRRVREDLPRVVARDYAGRAVVIAIAAGLSAAGIVHHPAIVEHQRAMRDAVARAQAWIGTRAPAEFRGNVQVVSTFAIEQGRIYRMCVGSVSGARSYCVIVKTNLPLARSVTFAGYEPNSVFAAGAG